MANDVRHKVVAALHGGGRPEGMSGKEVAEIAGTSTSATYVVLGVLEEDMLATSSEQTERGRRVRRYLLTDDPEIGRLIAEFEADTEQRLGLVKRWKRLIPSGGQQQVVKP